MKPVTPHAGTATAPLLYWLLIVCGLTGLTLQRLDVPREYVPLWIGTLAGVGLGQLVAWLRVRGWVLAAVAMAASWFSPVFFFVLYNSIRGPVEMCALAFIPAALCGYLSLSERGGLVAFWYPAVLWMLVILDGPTATAFDARAALPFVVALAALFVAFLRARETRRVALWQEHASARLATPLPRAVLRASPLRAVSQHVWAGAVGASALVLAAWIAPHLWQKESAKAKHPNVVASSLPSAESSLDEPCCFDGDGEGQRTRVREYFPLQHGQDEASKQQPMSGSCSVCIDGKHIATNVEGHTSGGTRAGWNGTSGSTYEEPPPMPPEQATSPADWATSQAYAPPAPVAATTPTVEKPHVVPPQHVSPPHAVSPPIPKPPMPIAPVVAAPPPVSPTMQPAAPPPQVASVKPAVVVFIPQPVAPPPSAGAPPWESMLGLCFGALGLHVLVRALRRQLTLRHLARPFWPETLDQRISNHWQRLLIGLRDAGIHVAGGEQPEALAKRVGLQGMDTCATILERVRHGVRVDAGDLEAMDAAAGAVYRAAREKAGVAGRAAGWLRWPLA